jgi:hypothetical protein
MRMLGGKKAVCKAAGHTGVCGLKDNKVGITHWASVSTAGAGGGKQTQFD